GRGPEDLPGRRIADGHPQPLVPHVRGTREGHHRSGPFRAHGRAPRGHHDGSSQAHRADARHDDDGRRQSGVSRRGLAQTRHGLTERPRLPLRRAVAYGSAMVTRRGIAVALAYGMTRISAVVLLVLFVAACDDSSPTAPTTTVLVQRLTFAPTPVPTPTPTPTPVTTPMPITTPTP